jgi:glutathione S-transferase
MTMKLYYAARTRAVRPRWLLEELGVPYELVRVDLGAGEHKTDGYKKKVHPLGKVPALIDGEVGIFESGAICQYLADKHLDRGLAPKLDDPARARYQQWMTFATATFDPELLRHGMAPDSDAKAAARASLDDIADALEAAIGDGQWLLGDRFTAADIMVGSPLSWAKQAGVYDDRPRLLTYAARVISRPAAVRARLD